MQDLVNKLFFSMRQLSHMVFRRERCVYFCLYSFFGFKLFVYLFCEA